MFNSDKGSIGKPCLSQIFGPIVLRIVTDYDLNLATTAWYLLLLLGCLMYSYYPPTVVRMATSPVGGAEQRIQENRLRILDVAQEEPVCGQVHILRSSGVYASSYKSYSFLYSPTCGQEALTEPHLVRGWVHSPQVRRWRS